MHLLEKTGVYLSSEKSFPQEKPGSILQALPFKREAPSSMEKVVLNFRLKGETNESS